MGWEVSIGVTHDEGQKVVLGRSEYYGLWDGGIARRGYRMDGMTTDDAVCVYSY